MNIKDLVKVKIKNALVAETIESVLLKIYILCVEYVYIFRPVLAQGQKYNKYKENI